MSNVVIQKGYRYKVYDSTGATYLGDLKNVTTDPNLSWDLASAGSQHVINIANMPDSFSEGTLIKFRNRIQVYCIDAEAPTGVLMFQGFISNWTPIYQPSNMSVDITVLSYGYELTQYVLQNFIANTNYTATKLITGAGNPQTIAQLIRTGPSQTQISAVDLILDDANASLINVEFYTVNVSTPNSPKTGTDAGGNTSRPTAYTPALFHFDLSAAPLTVTPNTQYWMTVDVGASGAPANIAWNAAANTYPGGKIATYDGAAWTIDTTKALYFVIYPNSDQTQIVYTNTEVSAIVTSALDNYALQGGVLTYDAVTGIVATGITVASITFNGATIFDILNKCADLAPNYYWYVDQTTNKVVFKKRAGQYTHKLTLGKDLREIKLQKFMENIVNTLLFTGGATSGTNLFREYIKNDSVQLYGVRTGVYNDSNVTSANQALADQIATAYFAQNAYPQVRAQIVVVDTAAGGYDLELFRPGDMLWIAGSKGSASSLWDVGQWDVDYWDFNLYDYNSMVLQITRINYTPGSATLDVSMVPPQVTKQIQAVAAGLQQQTMIANPATPTTIYL